MSSSNLQCMICKNKDLESSEIINLSCKHSYCWICITSYINENLDAQIKCPVIDCSNKINDNIIRQSLSDCKIKEYESKSIELAIKNEKFFFKCLLPECGNFVLAEENVQFECIVCSLFNCVPCVATHPFQNCSQYQDLKKKSVNSRKTQKELSSIKNKEFLKARTRLNLLTNNQRNMELQRLESLATVPSMESFACSICFKVISKGSGIRLRHCFHDFCKNCLRDHIKNSSTIPVSCLETNCKATLQDREVRGILSESEYDAYYDKCLMLAQAKLNNVFHCKTPDCKFYCIVNDTNVTTFICPSCEMQNCVKCSVIHKQHETCEIYQNSKKKDENVDLKTLEFIENEIQIGNFMKCPACGVIVKKEGGCNWVQCPHCHLELCWILKIARWGPKGRGDISGGCKCLVNQKPCDPRCTLGCIPDN